jgi:hypothetical protein
LYEEIKWEKLKDRRNNHKLVLFHKMNYNKTPQYLAELIPKTVGTQHTHNTRQINEFSDSKLRVGSGKSFHAFTLEDRKYSE